MEVNAKQSVEEKGRGEGARLTDGGGALALKTAVQHRDLQGNSALHFAARNGRSAF